MMRILLFALLCVAYFQLAAQIYSTDFSVDGQGVPDHTTTMPPAAGPASFPGGVAPNAWTASYTSTPGTDGTTNEFSVNSGAMTVQDFGGTGNFASQAIDVSGFATVDITGIGSQLGDNIQGGGSEFFDFFYILDGGTPVTFSIFNTSDGTPINYSVPGLDVSAASTLVIGFNFNVDGAGDGYLISNMSVVNAVPLPVTLTAFNAKSTSNGAILEWATASEENNDYFSIEMSRDAARFSESAQVKGNGTTESFETYSFEYANLTPGTYYFRLRQVDFDGQFSYSDVVSLTIKGGRDFILLANTVHDIAQVEVTTSRSARVLNMAGAQVAEFNLVEGVNTLDISALPNGMYILSDGNNAKRFVK